MSRDKVGVDIEAGADEWVTKETCTSSDFGGNVPKISSVEGSSRVRNT
jgi:hypothetical protein